MLREFGENVPKGTIYSINPALIIVLVPIISAATTDQDPLVLIHYGTYVSAASVFCLVISNSIGACITFVTMLSIGEAIWSPRLYDYAMSVCEEGREGMWAVVSCDFCSMGNAHQTSLKRQVHTWLYPVHHFSWQSYLLAF